MSETSVQVAGREAHDYVQRKSQSGGVVEHEGSGGVTIATGWTPITTPALRGASKRRSTTTGQAGGVDDVVNTITIRPTVATGNLKNALVAAFVRNARLEASDVTITASSAGVVTLDGQVHTWPEREQAERLAWSAPGVTLVHNHLKIRP